MINQNTIHFQLKIEHFLYFPFSVEQADPNVVDFSNDQFYKMQNTKFCKQHNRRSICTYIVKGKIISPILL